MTTITASMVAALRAKTDAPMMECKKVLTEAAGDMDKAEELLRVRLGNKASKAASRITAEGLIGLTMSADGSEGAMVEVNCETDFVTKNDDFLAMTSNLSQLILNHNPADLAALAALPLNDGTVESVRTALVGKIGENMSVRRFVKIAAGHKIASYVHNGRIGVLVDFTGDETAAKDVAMQIAATKPAALSAAGVDPALIEKERSVAVLKAAESGKPAEIVTKMVEGSVQKYLKEVSLLTQPFVKDDKQSVEQYLKSKATTVHSFTMFIVGEGIEKKVENFADEVAAQMAAVAAAKAEAK